MAGKGAPIFGNYGYALGVSNGNYFFDIGSSTGAVTFQTSYGSDIATGAWDHIAGTYNATTLVMSIYLNGSFVASTTGPTKIDSSNAGQFCISSAAFTCPLNLFDGLIDDVRVYDTDLSESEIASTYNCALVGDESNLVGYWKLDNDLLDSTSNNNDLTNNGSFVFSTDVNFTDDCGGAAVGSDSYILLFE